MSLREIHIILGTSHVFIVCCCLCYCLYMIVDIVLFSTIYVCYVGSDQTALSPFLTFCSGQRTDTVTMNVTREPGTTTEQNALEWISGVERYLTEPICGGSLSIYSKVDQIYAGSIHSFNLKTFFKLAHKLLQKPNCQTYLPKHYLNEFLPQMFSS